MEQALYQKLAEALGSENVLLGEPMRKHTTFRIGGAADYFVQPCSKEQTAEAIRICRACGEPFYIIGNGSNLLVGDAGVRGVVIQLFKNLSGVEVRDEYLTVRAGTLNSFVAKRAQEAGLSGFEFAAGIPGTIGGAVVMNAGAYGGEMKDVLETATVLTEDGKIRTIGKEELALGYRTSIIPKKRYVVLEAVLKLHRDDPAAIGARVAELREKRASKQPLEYPSAGSTFKRPEGYFAGKLIMDAGLRGFRVGGAQVSEKHCGFVINTGDAAARDVRELIREVQRVVEEKSGVHLEPEVKFLGEFEEAAQE